MMNFMSNFSLSVLWPRTVLILCASIALLALYFSLHPTTEVRTLTRDDLPKDAVFIEHDHSEAGPPKESTGLEEPEEPKGEMEHWATPAASTSGGPTYGVYGFSIVSIEYDVRESDIAAHMVGKEFGGWNLTSSFLGFKIPVPYNHFHIGIIEPSLHLNATNTPPKHEDAKYRIHFMLLPHEEELEIGLSCG